jgi:hypothetical protein
MPVQMKIPAVEVAPTHSRASRLKQPKVVLLAKIRKTASVTRHGIDLAMRPMALCRAVGGGSSEQGNELILLRK